MKSTTLLVTEDFTEQFNDVIDKFKKDKVLVGIPEDTSHRKGQDPINNAALLAINEFGSPVNNIPPRPVMKIGIKAAQDEIASQFKQAAQKALSDGPKAITVYYNRAGIIASNSVKKTINSQVGFKKPSKATIKAREAAGFKGTSALIVTGQMRNAITYVVQEDV